MQILGGCWPKKTSTEFGNLWFVPANGKILREVLLFESRDNATQSDWTRGRFVHVYMCTFYSDTPG